MAANKTRIDRPTLGRLEQGLIFTCALAEDYSFSEVWGITITARCDIAHDKAPILNYLPIVSFRDWMQVDGRLLISSRVLKQISAQQKSILEQCGLSSSILMVQTAKEVAETLFSASANTKIAHQKRRFTELAEEFLHAQRVQKGEAEVSQLFDAFAGISRQLISELATNNLSGFYFLPGVDPEQMDEGYVVLLREVRHIPRKLASLVASGLSRDQYAQICEREPRSAARLDFSHTDFSMPIGQLSSPEMEHLVQAFAFLFSRIGIDDWDRDYVAHLWAQCANI